MNDKVILDGLFYRLKDIQESKSILHINDLKIDGKPYLSFYSEVTARYKKIKKLPLYLYDDLSFFYSDLIHFTSLLFLFRPYINDAAKENGTYSQNWYDAKYLSYASILHSTVYNFWDRIGDLLNCFFETGLPDNSVYIGRVISNFPVDDNISMNFQQLKEIYINHVRHIVSERDEDAHNQSIVASHFYGIIIAEGEDQKQKTQLKFSLPDIFKDQIEFANKGFELSVCLIKERCQKL